MGSWREGGRVDVLLFSLRYMLYGWASCPESFEYTNWTLFNPEAPSPATS